MGKLRWSSFVFVFFLLWFLSGEETLSHENDDIPVFVGISEYEVHNASNVVHEKYEKCEKNHSAHAPCPTECVPPFLTLEVSPDNYHKSIIAVLMKLFELINEGSRGEESRTAITAACTQASAALATYQTLFKAKADYLLKSENNAGMNVGAALTISGELKVMLEQNLVSHRIKEAVRWCIDAGHAVGDLTAFLSSGEIGDEVVSPMSALQKLLQSSNAQERLQTERLTQLLLARCHDSKSPERAQAVVWSALSVMTTERFMSHALKCSLHHGLLSVDDKSALFKARLSLAMGDLTEDTVLAPLQMLIRVIGDLGKSSILSKTGRERIKQNCGGLKIPQLIKYIPPRGPVDSLKSAMMHIYAVEALDNETHTMPRDGESDPGISGTPTESPRQEL